MILYGLKSCDTCRKALKTLGNVEFVDVRSEGVPQDVLEAAFAAFGDKVLNTRSTTWRELSESERSGAPLELIRTHPTLMKRPLIADGDRLWLGWDKTVQQELGNV